MIRFRIAAEFYITGATSESIPTGGTFNHKGFHVTYSLVGGKPSILPKLMEEDPVEYFSSNESIAFEVADNDQHRIRYLLDQKDWVRLALLLGRMANRFLRAMRNFGYFPSIAEMELRNDEAERNLRLWGVERLGEDGKYMPILKPLEFPDILSDAIRRRIRGILNSTRWPSIGEALRYDLEPGPHREFVTNSLEHLRGRNFRYALLEAIIGLEIVLTKYLRLFLERRGLSKEKIGGFLGPQLGLRDRVSVILGMTMEPSALRGANIGGVLTAINWRNRLVHEQGNLPVVHEDILRDRIIDVQMLVGIIADKFEGLQAAPELQAASEELTKEFPQGLSRVGPYLTASLGGQILARFISIVSSAVPSEPEMRSLIVRTAEVLGQRVPRFNKDRHLTVRFELFPDETVAIWRGGELKILRSLKDEGETRN